MIDMQMKASKSQLVIILLIIIVVSMFALIKTTRAIFAFDALGRFAYTDCLISIVVLASAVFSIGYLIRIYSIVVDNDGVYVYPKKIYWHSILMVEGSNMDFSPASRIKLTAESTSIVVFPMVFSEPASFMNVARLKLPWLSDEPTPGEQHGQLKWCRPMGHKERSA